MANCKEPSIRHQGIDAAAANLESTGTVPCLENPGRTHGSKRRRPSSSTECGCNCQDQIRDLKSQVELLSTHLEARMHAYVQNHVQDVIGKMEASALVQPRKLKRSSKSQDRCCFVCGQEGTVSNRQLGVVLDDRCRKQMDVIKHGGKLTERKDMWERAIVHLRTPTAQMMADKLGVQLVDVDSQQNVTSCPADVAGEPCAVCMEKMGLSCRIQTLECGSKHTFHHECIESWLNESSTCPLCREDLSDTVQCRMRRAQPPTQQLAHNPCTASLCADTPQQDSSMDDTFALVVPVLEDQTAVQQQNEKAEVEVSGASDRFRLPENVPDDVHSTWDKLPALDENDTDLLSMLLSSDGTQLQAWSLDAEPELAQPVCSAEDIEQIP